jgi:ATP-binding cassette subfamily B protein
MGTGCLFSQFVGNPITVSCQKQEICVIIISHFKLIKIMKNQFQKEKPKGPQDGLASISDVLKEYWKSMRHYKLALFVVVASSAAAALIGSVGTPILYKMFFDHIAGTQSTVDATRDLIRILWYILAANITSVLLMRVWGFTSAYFNNRVVADLKERAFAYLIDHSYRFFSNNFTGGLTVRLNRFSNSFIRIVDNVIDSVLPAIIRVVGVIAVLLFVNKTLALVVGIWMVVVFVYSYFVAQWKLGYNIRAVEAESLASGALSDSISNHGTIQLFSGAHHEFKKFSKVVRNHTRLWRLRLNLDELTDGIQFIANALIEFVVFYIAIKYWGEGGITIGVFVLVQSYILRIGYDLWGLSRVIRSTYESFADAKEMVDIMKYTHEVLDRPDAKDIQVAGGAIAFNTVKFGFSQERIVLGENGNGLNLQINAGERVALIGPSGAGKSTLVRLILRLYDVLAGSVTIDGQNISEVKQESLRNAIGFVPQDPILFHRTLMDNIRYGRFNATDEEVIAAAKLAHCHEFVSGFKLGYQTFVGERGVKLSGGERQRIAIARAILKNAPILILDEATSSLDSHSETLIQDALDTLMKGKTVVVIAHRLSTIRKMDRIIVVDHGAIIEEGSHEKLLEKKDGMYAKLWSLQSGGFIKEDVE